MSRAMDSLRDFCKSNAVGRTKNLEASRKQLHEVPFNVQVPFFSVNWSNGEIKA